jgi:chlorocatechol 1,2-dioxygenase
MENRLDKVVSSIVDAVRKALIEHRVTPEEFRAGIDYLVQTAGAKELPLLIDVFFNITIAEIRNIDSAASPTELQGPYFREDAPLVTDEIQTDPRFKGTPMLLTGKVTDTKGSPIAGAELFIWQSTPDGKYSGFHEGVPAGFYRGKLLTGPSGEYKVRSTLPVPYQIKHDGPVGALLEKMGRHSWRPAHVHYKLRKAGFKELTTQAYFEGGEWVGDDCCGGSSHPDLIVADKVIGDMRLVEVDFRIERTG